MPSPRYGSGEGLLLTYGRRQGYLREFRVAVTLRRGEGKSGERGEPGAAARRPKGTKRAGNQNGWII